MGYVFEDLVRRFNEQANEEAGDHFTPREVIKLMVHLLFTYDDLVYKERKVIKIYDPACGTGGMLWNQRSSSKIPTPVWTPVPTSNSSARNTTPRPSPSAAPIS
jgi:type I restriction enzyme M protein